MKLLVAIAHQYDAGEALDALLAKDLVATRIDSAGGFLREGNVILLMGVEEDRMVEALNILKEYCRSRMKEVKLPTKPMQAMARVLGEPIQVKVGGALVFILDVDRFERW